LRRRDLVHKRRRFKPRKRKITHLSEAFLRAISSEHYTSGGLSYQEIVAALVEAKNRAEIYSGESKATPASHQNHITDEQRFEVYYHTSKGRSAYSVAKSLKITASTISRILNGERRAGRKPRPPFAQLLESDVSLKQRYQRWVQEKEL
jgi:hypothetical protein